MNANYHIYPANPHVKVKKHFSVHNIIELVETFFNIPLGSVLYGSQKREIADARAFVCWYSYHCSFLTVKAIGEIIGRDHSTVVLIKRKIQLLPSRTRLLAHYS